jgi:hypothetical protein
MTAQGTALAAADERNRSWNLKSFMDSLILELDRAQEALSVKGLTRPVTYTVKDVEVDLRCFPQFDGRAVRFLTAQPGQDGSSGLRFSLGSISAGTIRDSAPQPPQAGDVTIEALDDLDTDTKEALESVGVRNGRDLQRVAARGVDLGSVTGRRVPDYSDLAALITKARRRRLNPRVDSAALSVEDGTVVLAIEGRNLAVQPSPGYPYALLDGRPVAVRSASPERLVLDASGHRPERGRRRLALALDPATILTAELQS